MTLQSAHDVTGNLTEEAPPLDLIRVVLAGKRTSLATLRTGLTVFALPLSIVTALIATSGFYNAVDVLHLLLPVLVLSAFLVGVGVYLIGQAIFRLRRYNRKILEIEAHDAFVREFVEEP
ncbi:MAG: hypothetical protein ACE5JE_07980 [Thermoplasmata archaeon]